MALKRISTIESVGLLSLIVCLFCSMSHSAFARDSVQSGSCLQTAETQSAMNECADAEAARADAELNRVYGELLAAAAPQKEATAKIKASELAWIRYRDAYLDAMYPAANKQEEYGTIYPTEADLLHAELTRRQITALEKLLKQYKPEQK